MDCEGCEWEVFGSEYFNHSILGISLYLFDILYAHKFIDNIDQN